MSTWPDVDPAPNDSPDEMLTVPDEPDVDVPLPTVSAPLLCAAAPDRMPTLPLFVPCVVANESEPLVAAVLRPALTTASPPLPDEEVPTEIDTLPLVTSESLVAISTAPDEPPEFEPVWTEKDPPRVDSDK
jgi:hypothetical protein